MANKFTDLSIDGTSQLPQAISPEGFNDVSSNGMVTTEIKEQSDINEAALNKMATSIPTPFARLYLYDTAFAELNALEKKDENRGRAYKTETDKATLSHHLVSECLDMLEFIFEYGDDNRFTIQVWDVLNDTAVLGLGENGVAIMEDINDSIIENPLDKKHKKLGEALRDAVLNTRLRTANQIFIFKWDGEIVGGTSPFTLVYTSPNWRRKVRQNKSWNLRGENGNPLFSDIDKTTKTYALSERSEDFRKFIYALQSKYAANFTLPHEQGGTLSNINQYILNSKKNYEKVGDAETRALRAFNAIVKNLNEAFPKEFKSLKDTAGNNPTTVTSAGVEFFSKIPKPDRESDYIIKPTVANLPIETNRGGQKINMAENLPLVLSRSKLSGTARYWHKNPYNPQELDHLPDGDYFERILPGVTGNVKYPYLTDKDFFEDKIMWLGYKVNSRKFFTGYDGHSFFLLPLKPNFFKYFGTENLENMVKVTPEATPFQSKVTVTLDIPVKGGKIRFTKTYERAKGQYEDFDGGKSFKLGIFPFYTYAETPGAEDLDAYKVLLARMTDMNLEFYNQDFVTPLGDKIVSHKVRTQSDNQNTEYFTLGPKYEGTDAPGLPGTFKAIRVVKDGIGGMIVPLFEKARVSDNKYVFCVDFGTANSNVAYAKITHSNKNEEQVAPQNIRTLDYTADSNQLAMLNEEGSDGNISALNSYLNSEFVPAQIGEGDFKFPTRTMVCFTPRGKMGGESELFGDINIAFYTDKYGNTGDYRYQDELKWGHSPKELSQVFFQEIMWMCKNKVAELGGNPAFTFYFTFPQAMSTFSSQFEGWKTAAKVVRTKADVIDYNAKYFNNRPLRIFEGIAPWYHAIANKDSVVSSNEEYLNIDIGGGSTDAIYIARVKDGSQSSREVQGYSFSAKFAANDLWGDGPEDQGLTNGFLQFFEDTFEREAQTILSEAEKRKLDELIRDYEHYKASATGSSDMISYLFAHKEFGFADDIAGNSDMRLPMLVHFAATIYYAAKMLAMQQLALPKHVTFSGMGSLYIKYITTDTEVLADIVKAIFKFVGFELTRDGRERSLSFRFAENPKKITAEGGVLMFNTTRPKLTDKVVNSQELNFHLYNGEEDEEEEVEILLGNVDNYLDSTVKEVEKFLKLFEYKPFLNAVGRLEGVPIIFEDESMERFKDQLRNGFYSAKISEYPNSDRQKQLPIKAVLFFWPLKQAIYVLARDMATKVKNQI